MRLIGKMPKMAHMFRIIFFFLILNPFIGTADPLLDKGYSPGFITGLDASARQQLLIGPSLTSLNLHAVRFSGKDMETLVREHPQLELMDLRSCRGIRGSLAELSQLNKLKGLDLSDIADMNGTSLKAISHLKTLRMLSLDRWSELKSQDLAPLKELEKLQFLDLSSCLSLNVSCIAHLPKSIEVLSFLGCLQMQSGWIQSLASLPELRTLDLSKTRLSSDDLKRISEIKKLATLYLWETFNVDDGVMEKLPAISHIDVSHNYQISDSGVKSLAKRSGEKLETLHCSECFQLSDDAIILLSKTCPNISSLDLSGCTRLTDHAVYEGILRLKKLRHLSISRCPLISPGARQKILETLGLITQSAAGGE